MLFKRYSNVDYLLKTMKFGELPDFIQFLVKEENDEVIKEVWLSSPDKSMSLQAFTDKVYEEAKKKNMTKEEVEAEANAAMERALKALNSSETKERGGDDG